MITGNKREELNMMIPKVTRMENSAMINFELMDLQEADEQIVSLYNELEIGEIVHFVVEEEEIDVIKIWSGFGWLEDSEVEEFVTKYTESEGELVVEEGQNKNQLIIDRILAVNSKLEKISNTAETVNIGAYISKLEEIKKDAKSQLEVVIIDKKIKAMQNSLTFEPLMKKRVLGKIDKANFKKKKMECSKKIATVTGLSFPSTNGLLKTLNQIFPGQEKKNMKACIHIYDFILRSKMDEQGLFVYFALINIEGLLMEFNPLKEEVKANLAKMIDSI